jgi:hypothetical protein
MEYGVGPQGKHYRNRRCCGLGRLRGVEVRECKEHRDPASDQLGRERRHAIEILGRTGLKNEIAAFEVLT